MYRLVAEPWSEVGRSLVLQLRLWLTNDPDRGDFKDDGVPAGSLLKEMVDDANLGIIGTDGWWVVTCWPVDETPLRPMGWCLLHPVDEALDVSLYVDPDWRRRGVGSDVIIEASRLARHLGCSRLLASPWNSGAAAFFSRCGFASVRQASRSVPTRVALALKPGIRGPSTRGGPEAASLHRSSSSSQRSSG